MDMKQIWTYAVLFVLGAGHVVGAAQKAAPPSPASLPSSDPAATAADYRIGPEDFLSIVFWRDPEMSAEVIVRPDGKISLPLLNDVQAAGFTPEALRLRLMDAASKFIEEPTASVVVKAVNSRKVFITGMVTKGGAYPLIGSMNVLQLIAQAGGLQEFADSKNIVILRTEEGKTTSFKFNFNDVKNQKNLSQNIALRPGDTVVVP
jgi:polysaccharide biosynthesis/export protein